MTSDTLFLSLKSQTYNAKPNFANATGGAQFTGYSHSASGTLTDAQAQTFVNDGLSQAIANADATFINDPTFSELFTQSAGVGQQGAYEVFAHSQAKVVGNFSVGAYEKFSFDFSTALQLNSKEIENSNTEYASAKSGSYFFVLDTTNGYTRLLDYFGFKGNLISSSQVGKLNVAGSYNVDFYYPHKTTDINGNNGIDYLNGSTTGEYERWFNRDTNLTVVEVNTSTIQLLGDSFIYNLGNDVRYGSIWNDKLHGTNYGDKIYSSLGDDTVYGYGGNDILEGGKGDDKLYGDNGYDKLHGSFGEDTLVGGYHNDTLVGGSNDDILIGGRDSDMMTGGSGADQFVFELNQSLLSGEYDVIKDFEVGVDQIEFRGWGYIDSSYWFSGVIAEGRLTDTHNGALFHSNYGGKVLFEGVNAHELSHSDFVFDA
ncbi:MULTISPECIES: calcium-binding protein [unclassified Moorena]|uniref:calcium-binding protein n=1 Tax=unclassified Moorena TaxID=2683338 RepID=UPI0014014A4A|nr:MULTISPECIES: calcium-binding protein [unclassified Moorena]NEO13393.1 calcium-binding protein [Moorena sp. SIO3E8]NEP99684.1 calcium-binding protein [Moorena sp. SIO3F7]